MSLVELGEADGSRESGELVELGQSMGVKSLNYSVVSNSSSNCYSGAK